MAIKQYRMENKQRISVVSFGVSGSFIQLEKKVSGVWGHGRAV